MSQWRPKTHSRLRQHHGIDPSPAAIKAAQDRRDARQMLAEAQYEALKLKRLKERRNCAKSDKDCAKSDKDRTNSNEQYPDYAAP